MTQTLHRSAPRPRRRGPRRRRRGLLRPRSAAHVTLRQCLCGHPPRALWRAHLDVHGPEAPDAPAICTRLRRRRCRCHDPGRARAASVDPPLPRQEAMQKALVETAAARAAAEEAAARERAAAEEYQGMRAAADRAAEEVRSRTLSAPRPRPRPRQAAGGSRVRGRRACRRLLGAGGRRTMSARSGSGDCRCQGPRAGADHAAAGAVTAGERGRPRWRRARAR